MARQKTKTRDWPKVRKLTLPNGTARWEVDTGFSIKPRVRKRLETQEEAIALAERLRAQRRRAGMASFGMTDSERQDALTALSKAKELGVTLSECVDFYRKHARPPAGDVTVRELTDIFLESASHRNLRDRSVADLKSRVESFCAEFGERMAKEIATSDVEEWLRSLTNRREETRLSLQSFVNYRRVLHALFAFAERRGYLPEGVNPVARIEMPKIDRAEPEILSIAQARRLLKACQKKQELELGGYITLALYCGVRSEELARLDWSAVNLFERTVTISPKIAKKRRIRILDIPDAAHAWLLTFGIPSEGPVRPRGWQKRIEKLRTTAKITEWPANALRHTAGSMHYATYQDSAKTCAMLGQKNDDVLFDHYRQLVTQKTARLFYGLRPRKQEAARETTCLATTG